MRKFPGGFDMTALLGINGPDDARTGRKNEAHGEQEQENHQWQQPPFLLTRAEPEKLSASIPHDCEYDKGRAKFSRVLIFPTRSCGCIWTPILTNRSGVRRKRSGTGILPVCFCLIWLLELTGKMPVPLPKLPANQEPC